MVPEQNILNLRDAGVGGRRRGAEGGGELVGDWVVLGSVDLVKFAGPGEPREARTHTNTGVFARRLTGGWGTHVSQRCFAISVI